MRIKFDIPIIFFYENTYLIETKDFETISNKLRNHKKAKDRQIKNNNGI